MHVSKKLISVFEFAARRPIQTRRSFRCLNLKEMFVNKIRFILSWYNEMNSYI